jgi:hypothetical protein
MLLWLPSLFAIHSQNRQWFSIEMTALASEENSRRVGNWVRMGKQVLKRFGFSVVQIPPRKRVIALNDLGKERKKIP